MDWLTRQVLYEREVNCVEMLLAGRTVDSAAAHSRVPLEVAAEYAAILDRLGRHRRAVRGSIDRRTLAQMARQIVGPSPEVIDRRARRVAENRCNGRTHDAA